MGKLVANHMKIARVANAIYIQKGLSQKTWTVDDVLVGLWNFENKTMLEKFNEIPVGELKNDLKNLETALTGIPAILEKVNVGELNMKLSSLDSLKPTIQLMRKAIEWSVPDFLTDPPPIGRWRSTHTVKTCLDNFKNFNKSNGITTSTEFKSFLFKVQLCSTNLVSLRMDLPDIESKIDIFLNTDKDSRTLKPLVDGIKAMREFSSNVTGLSDLVATLDRSKTKFNNLQPLMSISTSSPNLQNSIEVLKRIIKTDGISKHSPVPSAFWQEKTFEKVFDDLKDSWLLKIWNKGKPLASYEENLKPLKIQSKHLTNFKKSMSQLIDKRVSVETVSRLLITLTSSNFKQALQLKALSACITKNITIIPETVGVEKLSTDLEKLEGPLKELKTAISKVIFDENVFFNLYNSITDHRDDNQKKVNFNLVQQGIDILNKLDPLMDDVIKLFQGHDSLKSFQPPIGSKEKIFQIRSSINATNLADNSTCNFENLDASVMNEVNEIIILIEKLRKNDGTFKLKSIEKNVAEAIEARNQMKGVSMGSGDFSSPDTSSLLDIASGISTLHRMSVVYEADADLQKVIGSDPTVQPAILTVKSATDKNTLTTTWNGFPVVSLILKDFGEKLEKLEGKLNDHPENSLEDVINTYKMAESVKFIGSINLQPFTNSFSLFDAPDANILGLEGSFKKINTPASLDLGLAPASFQKLTVAFDSFDHQRSVESAGDEDDSNTMFVIAGIVIVLLLTAFSAFVIHGCCSRSEVSVPRRKYN